MVRVKVKEGITKPWIEKENKPHHTSKERELVYVAKV